MAKKDWRMSLGDRKSERTTFKLSKTGWDSLSILAKWHGVKFKDVFEDLCAHLLERGKKDSVLYGLAKVTKKMSEGGEKKWEEESSRKTQVISRGALRILKEVSEQYQVPRDALVDSSLKFYMVHHENVFEETRKKHEKAAKLIYDLWQSTEALEYKLEEFLDEHDPVLNRFRGLYLTFESLHNRIEDSLKGGKPLDAWPHYISEEDD